MILQFIIIYPFGLKYVNWAIITFTNINATLYKTHTICNCLKLVRKGVHILDSNRYLQQLSHSVHYTARGKLAAGCAARAGLVQFFSPLTYVRTNHLSTRAANIDKRSQVTSFFLRIPLDT